MVSYGWTDEYISNNVTIPQMLLFKDMILQYPPIQIVSFGLGEKFKEDESEDKDLEIKLAMLGDKVQIEKFGKFKSVVRKRDGMKIK